MFGEFEQSDCQQLADRLRHLMLETHKIEGISMDQIHSFDSKTIESISVSKLFD